MPLKTKNKFSANISAPENFGNVANNKWKFQQNFQNYSITNWLFWEPEIAYQTSVFLAIIGEEADDINDGLNFDNKEDKMKLNIAMKKKF